MSNLWDDITKTIKEGVDTVVEKTEELTKIGRIKLDILNIKRKIEKQFTELGGKVYTMIAEENNKKIATDAGVKEIVDRIRGFEKELQAKNDELEQVKAREQASSESTAGAEPAS